MNIKCNRNMKVYEMSGYNYKPTPAIVLKGQWLSQFGFSAGDNINVQCEDGRLTVTRVTGDDNKEK